MEELLNNEVRSIEISGIRKFHNMMAGYKDVISLTIGQPDFETPLHIREAAKESIDKGLTSYTHNAGLLQLRQAASEYFNRKYSTLYEPQSEIIVTNGATEAIDTSLRTILTPGCEVILPGPAYPGYEPVIRLCGAIPVFADTRNTGFRLTASLIAEKLTEKTRCIIMPYPSNPTGCVLTRDELQEVAELLKDKDIFILSDEIYSELVYDGNHCSLASIPCIKDKVITINGLSKSHSMTGWRIGFIMGPSYFIKHALKVHQYNTTCIAAPSQYAACEALINGFDDALGMREEYRLRRDYSYNRLRAMGIDVELPQGAFYIFPSIKQYGMDSFTFALSLLEKGKVGVVPGSAFSEYGEGYIRISYACSLDTLEDAFDRLQGFIEKL